MPQDYHALCTGPPASSATGKPSAVRQLAQQRKGDGACRMTGKGVAYQQFVQILRGIGAILGDDPVFGDEMGCFASCEPHTASHSAVVKGCWVPALEELRRLRATSGV